MTDVGNSRAWRDLYGQLDASHMTTLRQELGLGPRKCLETTIDSSEYLRCAPRVPQAILAMSVKIRERVAKDDLINVAARFLHQIHRESLHYRAELTEILAAIDGTEWAYQLPRSQIRRITLAMNIITHEPLLSQWHNLARVLGRGYRYAMLGQRRCGRSLCRFSSNLLHQYLAWLSTDQTRPPVNPSSVTWVYLRQHLTPPQLTTVCEALGLAPLESPSFNVVQRIDSPVYLFLYDRLPVVLPERAGHTGLSRAELAQGFRDKVLSESHELKSRLLERSYGATAIRD